MKRLLAGGKRGGPHQHQQHGAGDGGDAHADAQQQGDADGEQAEHEAPVGPPDPGEAVVDAGERAGRTLRNPSVGEPPWIHALAEAVSWPSPNSLSRNGQRNVQPRNNRVRPQM